MEPEEAIQELTHIRVFYDMVHQLRVIEAIELAIIALKEKIDRERG